MSTPPRNQYEKNSIPVWVEVDCCGCERVYRALVHRGQVTTTTGVSVRCSQCETTTRVSDMLDPSDVGWSA